MIHIIKKVEYITGNSHNVFRETIETDDIERTRKELRECVKCDRILLVYDSISK